MTKLDKLAIFAVCYIHSVAQRRLLLIQEYADILSDYPSLDEAIEEGLKIARRRGF